MKSEGWVFLVVSWSLILALCVFCLRRVFARQRRRAQ